MESTLNKQSSLSQTKQGAIEQHHIAKENL
jgi:hypothetical protein